MVKMTASYEGGLHCKLQHEPSGSALETDAPKDNQGKGERFSPTDLMGAALASCILTTMAIVAEGDGVSLEGAHAEVVKVMAAQPRKIASLRVKAYLPAALTPDYRLKMQATAEGCPVQRSLHSEIDAAIEFEYV